MSALAGRIQAEQSVIISLAGPVAERRSTRPDRDGWRRLLTPEQKRAHHEAGHAVAAGVLGRTVYELSIALETEILAKKGSAIMAGYMHSGSDGAWKPLNRERLRVEGFETDLQNAARWCLLLAPDLSWRSALRCAKILRAKTERLLEDHWVAVVELAFALHRKQVLTGGEIQPFTRNLPTVSGAVDDRSAGAASPVRLPSHGGQETKPMLLTFDATKFGGLAPQYLSAEDLLAAYVTSTPGTPDRALAIAEIRRRGHEVPRFSRYRKTHEQRRSETWR